MKESITMEQTTLYFRQGSSDKVYQARIELRDGQYVVNFAFGRRGSSLAAGTKTAVPVSLDAARAVYEKLIKEKMAKGYTRGEEGTPYLHTDTSGEVGGIRCQLLNAVDERIAGELIQSPAYWMQEKFDGRRLLIRKEGAAVTGFNRLGFKIMLPATLIEDAGRCPVDFTIDGEATGDDLHAFDVLSTGGEDLRSAGFGVRYLRLLNLLSWFRHRHIHLVETAFQATEKARRFALFKEQQREGVVFKQIHAPYVSGRPPSGGSQLKYKFCETASFIVTRINARRSVGLMLFNGGKIIPAGNVTVPPNHKVPEIGQVVECRYLYAFRESGCIYQPVYLGRRDDIRAEDCTTAQLKYKAGIEDLEEEAA